MRYLFNDGWEFLEMPAGSTFCQAAASAGHFRPVELPHDWLIGTAEDLYRDGTGWYRKRFSYPFIGSPDIGGTTGGAEGRVFLIFDGVYMDSAYYLNGRRIGEWKYGYSRCLFDITGDLRAGDNELYVSATCRHPNSRWYAGAGIYRDVWIDLLAETYIPDGGIYISPARRADGSWNLRVEAEVFGPEAGACVISCVLRDQNGNVVELEPLAQKSEGAAPETSSLLRESEGAAPETDSLLRESVEAAPGIGSTCIVRRQYLVRGVSPWDVTAPVLYSLGVTLEAGRRRLQRTVHRTGFREITVDPDRGFLLNGRALKLHGVCEHHDLGALGAAFSRPAMRRKFRLLKEMGVNAVRLAHNMAAEGALELADEMGILLVSEAFDMWEKPKTQYDYSRFFREWHERDAASWIRRDRNHTSVIFWSIGNEIPDTHEGARDHAPARELSASAAVEAEGFGSRGLAPARELPASAAVEAEGFETRGLALTRELFDLVGRHDPLKNALPTIASNYMPWENAQRCADLVRIVGYNYAENCYAAHHAAHPDWVIYGSETGAVAQSRGIYHFPLAEKILAEEDGQCSALGNATTSWGAKSLEACIRGEWDAPYSMGQFLWSGFDYIGEPTPYHSKNSFFGQLDTAGFAKDAYYVWKAAWTEEPMVYVFPYWDFNEGEIVDVRVCSNAAEVELFLNGRSLGRRSLAHGRGVLADYRVAYEPGTLRAAAYDASGRQVAEMERRSFSDAVRLVVTPENPAVCTDDLLFLRITACDAEGNPVENAVPRVFVRVTGRGRLVGLDNGDSTDFDSYQGTDRRMFSGKLLAVVATEAEPGEIDVSVSAKGLLGDRVAIQSLPPRGREAMTLPPGYLRENREAPVKTGRRDEIPVRRLRLIPEDGTAFTPEQTVHHARVEILPPDADDREVVFSAVSSRGIPVENVCVEQSGGRVRLKARGDGGFCLRCTSRAGTDQVRVISQLEYTAEGLGPAWRDPYGFVSGGSYTSASGDVGSGNEKGAATSRTGETVLTYAGIDFGPYGSEEITVPIFELEGRPVPIEIWEGVPGEDGAELVGDVLYRKPSIWNTYQSETWRLTKRLRGVTSLSFRVRQKIHLKGFSFTRPVRAWLRLTAADADALYGDSFRMEGTAAVDIGNNVSICFRDMDLGAERMSGIRLCGRAIRGHSTIEIRFDGNGTEEAEAVEFCGEGLRVCEAPLKPRSGRWDVTFVFLPGSAFDFHWFEFLPVSRGPRHFSGAGRGAPWGTFPASP